MSDNPGWELDGEQMLRLKLVELYGTTLFEEETIYSETSLGIRSAQPKKRSLIERLYDVEKYILKGYSE